MKEMLQYIFYKQLQQIKWKKKKWVSKVRLQGAYLQHWGHLGSW